MIKIQIEGESRQVNPEKGFLGNDNENLQETLEFTFTDEFVDGQARLETIINGEKSFINLDKQEESYTMPVTNIMTKKGKVDCQLVITEGTDDEEIPLFKSNIFYFYVGESINAETGSPEPYIEWIDRANIKLNQIDNLDISATKVDHTATITITKKDGTEQSVEILDGEDGTDGSDGVGLDYNWQGTSLGIKREDEQGYEYVNLKGDTGPAGAIKMLIVNQLPLTGEEGTLYFVPKQDTETSDIYDEYMWVNNNWERLGEKQIVVDLSDYYKKQEVNNLLDEKADTEDIPDLTDYVKNTDYAGEDTPGIIGTSSYYGTIVAPGHYIFGNTKTYSQYQSIQNNLIISKGTLENVLNARIGDIDTILETLTTGTGV